MEMPPVSVAAVTPMATLSTRETRPLTVSGVVGIPGGFGLDVTYQVRDRWAVAGQLSSWIAVTEFGAQVRHFPFVSERCGFYVATGLHGLIAPILFPTVAPAASLEIGGEFRARNGFTIGAGVGLMGLYAPPGSEGGGNTFSPAPLARLRIGYSW